VREIAGRHAGKIPEDDARAIVDRWIHRIAAHADNTPTGRALLLFPWGVNGRVRCSAPSPA